MNKRLIVSAHDVSSGGMIVALAEMCLPSEYGLKIEKPQKLSNLIEYYFGEDQSRYLIEVEPKNLPNVTKILNENNIFNELVATVQKSYFEIFGEFKIDTNELYKINNKWYNNY